MAKYQVIGRVAQFAPGFILGLSADQAARRGGALESMRGGRYRVLAPVEFKAGEFLEVVKGDIGKADMMLLVEQPAAGRARQRAGDREPGFDLGPGLDPPGRSMMPGDLVADPTDAGPGGEADPAPGAVPPGADAPGAGEPGDGGAR